MKKRFYPRPAIGTGKTAMRVNSDFNEQRERIRQRVQQHIDSKRLAEHGGAEDLRPSALVVLERSDEFSRIS